MSVSGVIKTLWALAGKLSPSAPSTSSSPSAPSVTSVPKDIADGVSNLAGLVSGLIEGSADLTSVESAANSVQKVLVDLGLEPPEVAAAITAAEWLIPIIRQAYAAGLVSGGVPAAFPAGGGPGAYRGR